MSEITNNMIRVAKEFNRLRANEIYPIQRPVITSPSQNETEFSTSIMGAAYANTEVNDGIHTDTQLQLATDDVFTNIVVDNIYGAPVTTCDWEYTGDATTLYARIRYATNNSWSRWSPVVAFTQASSYVKKPVLSVSGYPDNIFSNPTISATGFEVVNGTDTHIATDWQVIKKNTGAVVFESINDTTNLNSIDVTTNLESGIEYIFKARFKGNTYGYGVYNSIYGETATLAAPSISLPNVINENDTVTGIIDNYDDQTVYHISSDKGTITYNDGSSFSFVHDNQSIGDETVTFSIYAVKNGYTSTTTIQQVTVAYINSEADAVISDPDPVLNASYNDGWTTI